MSEVDLKAILELLEAFTNDLNQGAEEVKDKDRALYFWLKDAVKHLTRACSSIRNAILKRREIPGRFPR